MAKQVTIENVRTEIAKLIRLCRWSARHFNTSDNIGREEESIVTLQDLCLALDFKVPVVKDYFVKGIYRTK